jgi:hypothetical protein
LGVFGIDLVLHHDDESVVSLAHFDQEVEAAVYRTRLNAVLGKDARILPSGIHLGLPGRHRESVKKPRRKGSPVNQ